MYLIYYVDIHILKLKKHVVVWKDNRNHWHFRRKKTKQQCDEIDLSTEFWYKIEILIQNGKVYPGDCMDKKNWLVRFAFMTNEFDEITILF